MKNPCLGPVPLLLVTLSEGVGGFNSTDSVEGVFDSMESLKKFISLEPPTELVLLLVVVTAAAASSPRGVLDPSFFAASLLLKKDANLDDELLEFIS